MVQRVVDVFEMIEIEKHQAQLPAAGSGQFNGPLGGLAQQCPVGQAGKSVVVRHRVNALLVELAVSDLAVQVLHGGPEPSLGPPLELFVRLVQGLLRKQVFTYVADDPDRPLVQVVDVDEAARKLLPEQTAVIGPQAPLCAVGMARAERGVGLAPEAARVASAGMQLLVAHAYHRVCVWISEDVGAALVAAHDDALANENDADARGVQRLLLKEVALDGGGYRRRVVWGISAVWVMPGYFRLRWTRALEHQPEVRG